MLFCCCCCIHFDQNHRTNKLGERKRKDKKKEDPNLRLAHKSLLISDARLWKPDYLFKWPRILDIICLKWFESDFQVFFHRYTLFSLSLLNTIFYYFFYRLTSDLLFHRNWCNQIKQTTTKKNTVGQTKLCIWRGNSVYTYIHFEWRIRWNKRNNLDFVYWTGKLQHIMSLK